MMIPFDTGKLNILRPIDDILPRIHNSFAPWIADAMNHRNGK